jgi:hypothetical protein
MTFQLLLSETCLYCLAVLPNGGKMIYTILVSILISFNAFATQLELPFPGTQCMSDSEAKAVYLQNTTKVLKSIEDEGMLEICPEGVEAEPGDYDCISTKDIENGANHVFWSEEMQVFQFGLDYTWYCAPAAECWYYVNMTCSGEMDILLGGED